MKIRAVTFLIVTLNMLAATTYADTVEKGMPPFEHADCWVKKIERRVLLKVNENFAITTSAMAEGSFVDAEVVVPYEDNERSICTTRTERVDSSDTVYRVSLGAAVVF